MSTNPETSARRCYVGPDLQFRRALRLHRNGNGSWASLFAMPLPFSFAGMRNEGTPSFPIPEIVLLAHYRRGLGSDAIAKRLGIKKTSVANKLEFLGVRRTKRAAQLVSLDTRQAEDWTGFGASNAEAMKAWRDHDRAWSRLGPRKTQFQRYYENHEENKKRAARNALARHYRMKNDGAYKMKRITRNVVARIYRNVGTRRAMRVRTASFLGCSFAAARAYLEQQFKAGMTWENHGTVWEVDHIKPLSAFNLREEDEMKKAMHFTNLQPLFVDENRFKAGKFPV